MKVKFEPGTYYIGDPSYAFADNDWDDLLSKTNYFSKTEATEWKDGLVWGASTMYGDGVYFDNRLTSKFSYPVDTGTIGIVSFNICNFVGKTEWDVESQQWVKRGTKEPSTFNPGNIFTFEKPFYASREEGLFEIGNEERMIEIETNDDRNSLEDEEWEEEIDYWDDEEEED